MSETPSEGLSESPDSDQGVPASLRLFSTREVARILQVRVRTVRKLIFEGKLSALRVGVQIRIPETAFEAFLEDSTCKEPDGRRDPWKNGRRRRVPEDAKANATELNEGRAEGFPPGENLRETE